MTDNGMKWTSVTVLTTTEGGDIVAQALVDCGSYGASIADKADIDNMQRPEGFWDMIDPSAYEGLGEGAKVTGYFRQDASLADNLSALNTKLAELRAMDLGGIDLGGLTVESSEFEENDWLNSWRQYYKPAPVGEHLVIKPTWEEYSPRPGDLIIHMDPGMAFGTGTHETTSMCLELSEKYVKDGDSIIDIGCGTAILSIASVLLGAKDARAIDIDMLAVDCATQNVQQNLMQDKITVVQGDLLSGSEGCEACDVMFANIVAGVIVMLSPDVPKKLKKSGHFICSGIIREREEDVVAVLTGIGLVCVETRRKGEWVAMCWKYE